MKFKILGFCILILLAFVAIRSSNKKTLINYIDISKPADTVYVDNSIDTIMSVERINKLKKKINCPSEFSLAQGDNGKYIFTINLYNESAFFVHNAANSDSLIEYSAKCTQFILTDVLNDCYKHISAIKYLYHFNTNTVQVIIPFIYGEEEKKHDTESIGL